MALTAKMGYVGSVQLESVTGGGANTKLAVRVTSADIKTTQEISYPEVIDGKIDTTLYQLGPKITGGSIAFPLVHEGSALSISTHTSSDCTTSGDTLAKTLWEFAAKRDSLGRMFHTCNAHVRYADNLAYAYPGCLINTMTWTIAQSAEVSVTAEVIGGANVPGYAPGTARAPLASGIDSNLKFLAPARVVTWNDARIAIYKQSGIELLQPSEIREFSCTLNNGIERYFTLNNRLAPQDIAAKKREISGNLKLMGHSVDLSAYTETNETRFTSDAGIGFGYSLGANATPYWATGLYGVVFEIEEVALSTGLFETSTKWRALGDCTNEFLATRLGTAQAIAYPTSGQYGQPTAPGYPNFTNNGQ